MIFGTTQRDRQGQTRKQKLLLLIESIHHYKSPCIVKLQIWAFRMIAPCMFKNNNNDKFIINTDDPLHLTFSH